MPNLLFIGIPNEEASRIIKRLIEFLPEDMKNAVFKAYPDDAPVYAMTGEPAPYVIIRDSDQEQAIRLKDRIQQNLDPVNGALDVEIEIIQFYEGGWSHPPDSDS